MRTALLALAMLPLARQVCAQGQRDTASSRWCNQPGRNVDSTFLVEQAVRALTNSATKRLGVVFRVDDYQVIRTARLEQGVVISLVVARPTLRGGGGLVWVDTETACAIVLKPYE